MLDRQDHDELLATEARFRALVAEWDLGHSEVAALLGVGVDELGLDLVPRVANEDAEHRVRLLVEVRALLPRVLPDYRDVVVWLRMSADGIADEEGRGAPCVLRFMSRSRDHIRAVKTALEARTVQ